MRIGIIGSGNVGGALGLGWARAGHSVVFSSRNPASDEVKTLLQRAAGKSKAATPKEAAQASEVLLLATPWPAAKQAVEGLGDIRGKLLIDATNPLLPDLSGLQLGTTTSAAEQVAQWSRGAKVVKAFNTVGSNVMEDPAFGAERALLFFCGDDEEAKQTVKKLAEELGFDAHDAGALQQARLLEPFALLWISLAIGRGYGREFAFKIIKRQEAGKSAAVL